VSWSIENSMREGRKELKGASGIFRDSTPSGILFSFIAGLRIANFYKQKVRKQRTKRRGKGRVKNTHLELHAKKKKKKKKEGRTSKNATRCKTMSRDMERGEKICYHMKRYRCEISSELSGCPRSPPRDLCMSEGGEKRIDFFFFFFSSSSSSSSSALPPSFSLTVRTCSTGGHQGARN